MTCPLCRRVLVTPPSSPIGPQLRLEDLGQIDDSVLNPQQLARLRRIVDYEDTPAYLDEEGIFGDNGMLYDQNGEKLGYYEDLEHFF